MKIAILALSLLILPPAFAGFGGGRSGGFSGARSFSSGRSFSAPSRSFGGARSAPSVTITRPTPPPPAAHPAPIIQNHYNGGGSSNGLLTGMMVGSMLSQPHTTVVTGDSAVAPGVVSNADGTAYMAPAAAVAIYEHGWLYYFWWTFFWLVVIGFAAHIIFTFAWRET